MKTKVVLFNKQGARILINPDMDHLSGMDYIINPDLSKVKGLDLQYWTKTGNDIVPMDPSIRTDINQGHGIPIRIINTINQVETKVAFVPTWVKVCMAIETLALITLLLNYIR